jgi:hypothetical protein
MAELGLELVEAIALLFDECHLVAHVEK